MCNRQLPAGASDLVTITLTAPSTAGDVTNTATVTANEPDPVLSDNTASVTSHVGEVDVSLSQTASPVPVTINQPLSLAMSVGSLGAATGVKIKDTLPSGLHYVSAAVSQGMCSASGQTVTCALGAIADGGSAQVTLKVTPVSPGPVTNTATVSASQPDFNTANNTASAQTFVNPAACGEVITSSTTLNADIGPCDGDGVIIGSDGITLNLNGHSILGAGLRIDNQAGIRLPIRSNVTIENGSVTGFAEGIFVNSGGGNTITHMNVHDNIGPDATGDKASDFPNFGDGILIQHSAANRILNSTITHNGIYDGIGIFGLDANFNLVQGNTVSQNFPGAGATDGEGIALSAFLEIGDNRRGNSLHGNNIIGNTIVDNAASGISSVSNVDGQYLNNDVERNGLSNTTPQNGIGLQHDSAATANTDDLVQNNKVMGNGNDGIQALNTTGNQITNNTTGGNNVNNSGGADLDDRNGDCGFNVWTGNTYGSGGVTPACLASTNQQGPVTSTSSPVPLTGKALVDRNLHQQKNVGPRTHGQLGTSAVAPATTSAAPATSPPAPPACGSLITASITLTADVGPCPASGLIVGADNITINLGGHKIVGSGTGDGTHAGVVVFAHHGVTVTHGSISSFDAGVEVNMGANDTVSNLYVHDNIGPTVQLGTEIPPPFGGPNTPPPEPAMSDGIAVFHSFAVQVVNNTVTHNGVHSGIGIYGLDANTNTIKGNTVTNTVGAGGGGGDGIVVSQPLEVGDPRFFLPIQANNVLSNIVTGNQGAGIWVVSDVSGLIKGNTVTGNGIGKAGLPRDGIRVDSAGFSPATLDSVLGNSVSGSGDNGIAVFGGGNIIQGNTAKGDNVNKDGSFDLFDSHPTCDHNTWQGNTSGSAGFSPACT